LTVDRRQSPDRRQLPQRPGGRRLSDPLHPEVDVRTELARMMAAAREQGKLRLEAVCCLALATINELETALAVARASRQRSGTARAASLTAERRKEIAVAASKRRWRAGA
jgi:hypothetical protein